jgi:hypothetical protein
MHRRRGQCLTHHMARLLRHGVRYDGPYPTRFRQPLHSKQRTDVILPGMLSVLHRGWSPFVANRGGRSQRIGTFNALLL